MFFGLRPVAVEGFSRGEITDIAQSEVIGICKYWDRNSSKLCLLKWGIKNNKYIYQTTKAESEGVFT